MKVVLLQDVKDLGKKGQLVTVADGYGKNFLIPRKLAKTADAAAMGELKSREAAEQYRKEVARQKAVDTAAALEGRSFRVSARAGQNGKLFGSVTTKDIADAVNKELGVDVDKKHLSCDDIRNFGTYEVSAKLYSGVTASFYVIVGE